MFIPPYIVHTPIKTAKIRNTDGSLYLYNAKTKKNKENDRKNTSKNREMMLPLEYNVPCSAYKHQIVI